MVSQGTFVFDNNEYPKDACAVKNYKRPYFPFRQFKNDKLVKSHFDPKKHLGLLRKTLCV